MSSQFPTTRRITRQMRREMSLVERVSQSEIVSNESLRELVQTEELLLAEFTNAKKRPSKPTAEFTNAKKRPSKPTAEYIAGMSHPNMVLTFYNEYTLGNIAEDAYIDYIGQYVIPSVRKHLINVDNAIYRYEYRRYYKAVMFQRIAEFLNENPMYHDSLSHAHCLAYCRMIDYYFNSKFVVTPRTTFATLIEK
jgi:hypothetical protein